MENRVFEFSISTKKEQEFLNITDIVNQAVEASGVKNGLAVVYCPHTTAGITINENSDPAVVRDIIMALDRVFPVKGDYRHFEGNSHAHLKSSYMGVEKTVIIDSGRLLLGTWQGIYFCDFDGPRSRKVFVKIMEG